MVMKLSESLSKSKKKTWSGFWSGLIWFAVGFICIVVTQTVAVVILAVKETIRVGAEPSEERVNELMLNGDAIALSFVLLLPIIISILAFAVKVRRKQPLFVFLGFRHVSGSVLVSWSLYAVGLIAAIIVCDRIFDRPPVSEWMLIAYDSAENIWLFWLSVALLGPISEELLYRGYIIKVWAESVIGPILASILLSMMWAATHLQYDLYDMAWVFILGVILCISRLQTNSIIPAIIMHVGLNTAGLVMLVYYRSA